MASFIVEGGHELHGEITPLVPQSILQTLRTDVYVSETIASDIENNWETGY